MSILLIVIIISYIISGILSYGITLAHFQRKYPSISKEKYKFDVGFAIFFGFCGFFGLFVSFLLTGFAKHGLKFK